MTSSNPFSRAFSLRDKRRAYSKNRNNADFDGLFTLDAAAKKPTREEEKKIEELKSQLESLGLNTVPDARIEYVVRSKGVDGDLKKAYRLLMLFEDSVAGVLKHPDPNVRLLGAENREKVTCYLDSLLFAMFVRVEVFEAMLFNSYQDLPRQRLVTVLRLWVNMLRTGRLITTDITQHLQEALSECGWTDAAKIRQQDASEAFSFITDKLNLPLVTLKTDLFHAGKEDSKDDHKFITERMLDVAIPESVPQDGPVTLEQCLEEYFNNRVEVKRELQRRNTASRASASSMEKTGATHVETVELTDAAAESPKAEQQPKFEKRPTYMLRERATSIFSERSVTLKRTVTANSRDSKHGLQTGNRPRSESVKKEVLMPAWQFLNLIPWYTNNAVQENSQIASYFSSRRPMLGICLKRYQVHANGSATRLDTKVDIPLEMASPHFADQEDDAAPTFKLVLQSVVCHRGHSVNAGHYIAMARAEPSASSRHGSTSSGSEGLSTSQNSDGWLRIDDLAPERVTTVNIQRALQEESPYLLFYRIEPILGADEASEPPPYSEADEHFATVDQKLAMLPEARGSMDTSRLRPSVEIVRPDSEGATSPSERRQSLGLGSWSKAASLKTDQTSTAPVSPYDEQKGNPNTLSKQTSATSASKSRRHSSDSSDKKLSAKIRSRISKEKVARPEVIVDEGEDVVEVGDVAGTAGQGSEDGRTWLREAARSKPTEKRSRLRSMSRRRSLSKPRKGGVPERDCVVM